MENKLLENKGKSVKKTTIYPKSIAIALVLMAQVFAEIFATNSYLDEVIGLLSTLLVVVFIFAGKTTKFDRNTIMLLGVVVFLGLLSNLRFSINESLISVGIDVLTQIKVIMVFFAIRYFLTERERQAVIGYITPIAKIFIISAFVCALLNQFFDIHMGTGTRYGLKVFDFIFEFNHQFAACTLFFFGILVCSEKISEKRKNFYCFIGLVVVLSALKSISIIAGSAWIFLSIYFTRYEKISLKIIIPMVAVMILLSQFQINRYLLNTVSPRRVFIDYAIIDANDHFPLGSGFGTFGSAEAAKNYSPLYYEYGFDGKWGMSPTIKYYLHDNYWQAALGQFGWIGFALFVIVYIRWFMTSLNPDRKPRERALQYAMFLSMIVFAIGSAAISSSPGVVCFAGLSLFSTPEEKGINRRHRIKVHW